LSRSPAAIGAIASVAVITVAALWGIAQPLRSSNAYYAATTAAIHGNAGAALADARSAADEDPVSVPPMFLLAKLYSELGNPAQARNELTAAVSRQPANPQTWVQLGCYDLSHRQTSLATSELHRALAFEPSQTEIESNPGAFCAPLTG
jgi:Tfp pilus assembly protein PilF